MAEIKDDSVTSTSGTGARDVIAVGGDGPITIPGGPKLLTAEFFREGDDLVIANQDGSQTVVSDYFAAAQPADLSTGAAVISGHTVELFAQSLGATRSEPSEATVVAASRTEVHEASGASSGSDPAYGTVTAETGSGKPIAALSDVEGEVVVIRADGSRVSGQEGTTLYEDDIVTTGADSSTGLRFVDEMTFSLGSDARMVLDEFVYEPEAGEGGGFFSILQGSFSFVSGEAAHFGLDSLKIETPTMTIGVRGTKVAVQAAAEGETSRIALLAEDDGTVGKIMVTTDAGSELISEANTMVEVVSRYQPPSTQIQLSSDQIYQHFGAPLSTLPRPDYRQEGSSSQDGTGAQTALASGSSNTADLTVATSNASTAGRDGPALPGTVSESQFQGSQETGSAPAGALDLSAPVVSQATPVAKVFAGPAPATIDTTPEATVPSLSVPAAPTVSEATVDPDTSVAADPVVATAPEAPTVESKASEEETASATALNSAPLLDISAAPALSAIQEDTTAPAGNTVAEIVVNGSISDADGAAVEAIAVTSADNTNGAWQYSLDGGGSFSAIGAVSDAAALLLDSSAVVRFVPNSDYSGTATIGYRAWDQSTGSSGQSGVDVSANGGTTAYSTATETAAVTVSSVNDAPVLDTTGTPSPTAVAEDDTNPSGDTVAQIMVDGSVTDGDGGAVEAMAVTGVDDSNGTWQYSIDGGTSFNAIGAVSDSSALLLDASAIIRFVPNAGYTGTANFVYRAWDQSSGANGQSGVDVSINGGATAFSTASELVSLTVSPTNDAPVLDTSSNPNLTPVAEDAVNPTGNTVAQIVIDGSITDPDGSAVEAIAVTSADNSNGTWQYSVNGGASFSNVGTVSDNSALLLDSSAVIRFVPNGGFNGTATIGYRAWDQSSGSNGQSGVDVSTNGGMTPYSTATETAAITVTAANDAPVLDTAGSPALTSVAEDDTNPGGDTVAQIVIDGSITDPDGGAVEAIAVTSVDDSNGTWQFSINGGASFSAIGAVSDTSALLLDSSAIVRFVPNAGYNGSATFGYRAWDMSAGSSGQSGINVSTNGDQTPYSAATETASVTVTAVNDAPLLDASGSPNLSAISEDSTAPAGNTVAQIVTDGSITDADGSAVEAIAVTAVDDSNGTWQFSTNGGASFSAFGAVSDNAAVLLDTNAVVRFVPNASYNGSATFTYRAWDQSTGSNGQTGVDVSTNGGTTAFSSVAETAAITVTATNDAPVLDTSGSPTLTAICENEFGSAGNTVAQIVVDGSVTDPDGSPVEAIAVTAADNANGAWQFSIDGGSTFTAVGSVSDTSALLLDSSAVIRFVPNAGYDGSATFSYRAWDMSTGSNGQSGVNVSANGGTTPYSAAVESASIAITAKDLDLSTGSEFQVNTTTAGAQKAPAIAAFDDGGYVIAWQSKDQDGDVEGIYAQRYDSSGAAIGAEFLVNSTTADAQKSPAVATLDGGGFVIAWQSDIQDGSQEGIYAQRYDSNGTAQGAEFLVNSTTSLAQVDPAVAGLGDGGFVIIWQSDSGIFGEGIYGQRYDSSGAETGIQFLVNSYVFGDQVEPSVAALSGGGFVVTWESASQDGSGSSIHAQRYDAAGARTGFEFQINTTTAQDQAEPVIAGLQDGGFVVAWTSTDQDGDGKGVFAQRYDANGNKLEFEFRVNTYTTGDQKEPAVTALNDGGFVVSWTSRDQDGDAYGIYAQRFDADGDRVGSEIRVNTTTQDAQKVSDLAALSDGGLVATWQSQTQDGDREGIFAHEYSSETASVTVNPPQAVGASVLDFGGSNSFVDAGDPGALSQDLDPFTGDLTVEAWFHYSGANGKQTILSKGNATESDEGFSIFLDGADLVVRLNTNGGSTQEDMAATSITLPADLGWHHVAFVVNQEQGSDASSITAYLDGVATGWSAGHGSITGTSFTTPTTGIDATESFLIGASDTGSGQADFFGSQIADVRVWDTVRTGSEVQNNLSLTLGGDESNLVANWQLYDGAGSTAANAVTGGANGSLSGGPSWTSATSFTIQMDNELDGRITASDPEDDSLSFSVSANAANGTATIDAGTGAWEYTPNGGYTGNDSFSYQVSDGNGGTDTINIDVTVTP